LVNNELCLSAGAFERHHGGTRCLRRDFRAEIAPHQMEAQIEPRRGAGRRQEFSIVDVQHVRVDVYLGIAPGQFLSHHPVGRRLQTIECSRSGEYERTRANRCDPGTPRGGATQYAKRFLRYRPVNRVDSRYDHGPGALH
jgi:hypothetical protein